MPTAPSQTRIANVALTHLGTAKRIQSLDDGSSLAGTLSALWDNARDVALADHPFNFALARTMAPASADYVPAFGYARAFELPADQLRWLPPAQDDEFYFAGEQEGQYVLSDEFGPLPLRYIRRIEDVSRWSPGFSDLMGWSLAREGVDAVTGGMEGVARRMQDGYAEALERAKRQDGLATGDRSSRLELGSSWNAARWGGDGVRSGRYLRFHP